MLRRIVPAAAVVALALTGLTACGAQSSEASDCEPSLKGGALSDAVKVKSGFGETPEVTIPEGVEAATSQRSYAEKAKDRDKPAVDDTLVGVNMAFFDAASGEQLYASPEFLGTATGSEYLLLSADKDQQNVLSEAVRCAVPGDRLVLGLSDEESAALATQLGKEDASQLVGVIDVDSTAPLRAEGSKRGLPSGFPEVVTNETGRPGIVLPPQEAPETTKSATRIVGDGEKISADDGVIAQVLTVSWDGSVVSNTWETSPTGLGTEDQISQTGNTFRTELTGKTVGSQVVIIEPSDDGANVVVVDVLGVN